jgi:beta-glucan synthesis-associated protein KRE6
MQWLFMKKPVEISTGLSYGMNASGQVPSIGNFGLIDKDTPEEALTKKSTRDGTMLQLVFSDEFNQEGRSFYPGDDPYWEAVDLHYWGVSCFSYLSSLYISIQDLR